MKLKADFTPQLLVAESTDDFSFLMEFHLVELGSFGADVGAGDAFEQSIVECTACEFADERVIVGVLIHVVVLDGLLG